MWRLFYKCRCISREKLYRHFAAKSGYEKTFHYRILNYFEDQLCTQEALQKYSVLSQVKNEISEFKTAKQELRVMKEKIAQLSNSIDSLIKNEVIDDIDKKCLPLIDRLEYSDILSLLNIFSRLFPDKLMFSKIYQRSLVILFEAADINLLSDQQLIQLVFFVSLKKKNGTSYIKYMQSHLPDLKDLPLIEKCIIAQAFYKTSVKFNFSQLRIFEKILEDECEKLMDDTALLVSVCKAIRLSRPSDELYLKNFNESIMKLKKSFDFTTYTHILSLYAEALIYEPEVINKVVKDCIEIIKKDKLTLKHFDRFLWSISYLGFILIPEEKDILKHYLEFRLKEYSKEKNLGYLVNSMLRLHMLKAWNTKVVMKCFKNCTFKPIFQNKFHWKVKSRLQLLMTQIAIELKIEIPQPLLKQIEIPFKGSTNINLVEDVAKKFVQRGLAIDCKIDCPISNLMIPGVTLTTDFFKYHIDILNQSTCLRNTDMPHGLMKFKSRLLHGLEYRHIILRRNIFEDTTQTSFIIEDKILKHLSAEKMNTASN